MNVVYERGEGKLVKPLLIFQLNRPADEHEARLLTNTIIEGIEKGALVVDSTVTILSFDEEGKLNYCTREAAE